MKALIRMTVTRSPSERFRGYRLQAAAPNMEGFKCLPKEDGKGNVSFLRTKQKVPSFTGRHLVAQTYDLPYVNRAEYDRFVESLKWQGFTEFEPYGKACIEAIQG